MDFILSSMCQRPSFKKLPTYGFSRFLRFIIITRVSFVNPIISHTSINYNLDLDKIKVLSLVEIHCSYQFLLRKPMLMYQLSLTV